MGGRRDCLPLSRCVQAAFIDHVVRPGGPHFANGKIALLLLLFLNTLSWFSLRCLAAAGSLYFTSFACSSELLGLSAWLWWWSLS